MWTLDWLSSQRCVVGSSGPGLCLSLALVPKTELLGQVRLVLTDTALLWLAPGTGRNCDLPARPRWMRALMILKIVLESKRRAKLSRAPSPQRSPRKVLGSEVAPLAWLLWAGGACQPVVLHEGQSPGLWSVLSEGEAQNRNFRFASHDLVLGYRITLGAVLHCTVGCLPESWASTHSMPVALP